MSKTHIMSLFVAESLWWCMFVADQPVSENICVNSKDEKNVQKNSPSEAPQVWSSGHRVGLILTDAGVESRSRWWSGEFLTVLCWERSSSPTLDFGPALFVLQVQNQRCGHLLRGQQNFSMSRHRPATGTLIWRIWSKSQGFNSSIPLTSVVVLMVLLPVRPPSGGCWGLPGETTDRQTDSQRCVHAYV